LHLLDEELFRHAGQRQHERLAGDMLTADG
jgi:hypothetical protein